MHPQTSKDLEEAMEGIYFQVSQELCYVGKHELFQTLIASVSSLRGCLPGVANLTSPHMLYILPAYLPPVPGSTTPLLYTLPLHSFLFLAVVLCQGLIFH